MGNDDVGAARSCRCLRRRAQSAGLSNIEFVVLDVYDFTRADTFDVAYCRNLLQHLSRPEEVLRAVWASVRTGGVIVVEDADFEGRSRSPDRSGQLIGTCAASKLMRRRIRKPSDS